MRTKRYVFILALFVTSVLSAQVDLEIADGMLVETTGGLEIQVSGDVVENGSGYLNGVVTSGIRGAVTQFASLTLSSPLDGEITRITGKPYPATGTNFTRYYEVDNQDDSGLTANVTTLTTTAEHGSMTGPFFHYTKNKNTWKSYGLGSSGNTIVSNDVLFPHNSVTDLIISEGVGVKAKIFLEGPYNAANHNMNNSINDIIPLTSTYSADARTVSNKPSTVVDWVLVQLRDQTTPSTVIASRSAFLNSDGNIIDDNTTPGISIAAPAGDYYIVIKHRNHLAVMSANTVAVPSITVYDFTTSDTSYYGTNGEKELESGVWGMIAGDANGDGQINASDRNENWNYRNQVGFLIQDVNLDAQVNASDRNITWNNRNLITQVPVP